MIRDICPGDPSDIKCCVRSPSKPLPSGSRPASSSLDSNNVHIPGIARPNLPDTMVPDISIFDPQDPSKFNEYFLQRTQSETPSTDDGGADLMAGEDPYLLYSPDEELWISFVEDPYPGSDSATNPVSAGRDNVPTSDLDSAMFQSSEPSSDDDELAAVLFGEYEDQESPGFLG